MWNLRKFNQALLGKWLRRYGIETNHLWWWVIEIKYGNIWGWWRTKEVTAAYGVSLWRAIRQGRPVFSKSIIFKVGNGSRIKLWHHLWWWGCILREAFPELYSFSCNKDSYLADVMSFRNQQLFWDLRFYREPQDWETEQFDIFWNLIHSMTFIGEGQEKLCWKSTKNKGFKVSEFYLSLFSTSDNLFLWKSMWCSNIPLRVAFFSWTAALGKILTLDRLWNKGVPVMDWCYMCKRSGELVNHLLLHCPIAFELWSMVWSLFGGIWVMPQSVANLFASW